MRTKIENKNGITLTELLIASILVGIVMIGVASFSVSLIQLHTSTNRTAILAMRTVTAMNYLTKDAYLAIGEELDPGIEEDPANIGQTICFRHDDTDPSIYTDDDWTCYFYENATNELSRCTEPALTIPPTSTALCDGGGTRNLLLTLDPAQANDFYQIIEDVDNRLESVVITLQAIFNPTLPVNPITNPTYTATSTISPPGHSR